MPNIATLFSGRKDDEDDAGSQDEDNSRFVGGLDGRGGGSGLAVFPTDGAGGGSRADPRAAILGRAQQASAEDAAGAESRRTITMYRDGFTIDDGPYRRLDDSANADFLRSLATGQTPRELAEEARATGDDVTIGLVDKRTEDYEETFRSFSGAGAALGSSAPAAAVVGSDNGVIDPSSPPPTTPAVTDEGPKTSVQVRLLSGKRIVVKLSTTSTVLHLVNEILSSGDAGSAPFVLAGGFPPKPVTDLNASIKDAGLAGASVTQKKA
jgi:UBX domain-containing protein 1